jgi:subtilisin
VCGKGGKVRRGSIVRAVVVAAMFIVPMAWVPLAGATGGAASDAPGELRAGGARAVPGSYIVVLAAGDPGSVAEEHRRAHGATVRHVYRHAVRGYAASMSAQAAARVAADPRVDWVEQEVLEEPVGTVPTGVDRIEADQRGVGTNSFVTDNTSVFAPVAIVDTGIYMHKDLNVAGGRNFTGGGAGNWGDSNGHGTHVAGTVAARGEIFGVAPGAPVWSVRVCRSMCSSGDIVAGLDWITQQKNGGTNFSAANFSISSADTDTQCTGDAGSRKGVNATHTAICGVVDAGVVFVMAAGNDGRLKKPYPEAFAVSAVVDYDGKGGGKGGPTCRSGTDDTLASFSNYGPRVDIAAPGVCITSTWNNGGYNTISGTSMAAPHVTGAVALHLHLKGHSPAKTMTGVETIRSALVAAALPQGTSDTNPCSYNATGDIKAGKFLFFNGTAYGGDGKCGLEDEGDTGDTGDGSDPSAIDLGVRGYKVKGVQHADLKWGGVTPAKVDIYRNGTPIDPLIEKELDVGEGTYTDNIGNKGGGSYTYKVCEAGSTTACSNEFTVSF